MKMSRKWGEHIDTTVLRREELSYFKQPVLMSPEVFCHSWSPWWNNGCPLDKCQVIFYLFLLFLIRLPQWASFYFQDFTPKEMDSAALSLKVSSVDLFLTFPSQGDNRIFTLSHLAVLLWMYYWSRGMWISCLVHFAVSLQIMVAISSISESVMYFFMAYLCFEFLISEKTERVKFWLNIISKKMRK